MLVKNWQQSPVHNLLTMFDIRMAELYKEQTRFRNAQTSIFLEFPHNIWFRIQKIVLL